MATRIDALCVRYPRIGHNPSAWSTMASFAFSLNRLSAMVTSRSCELLPDCQLYTAELAKGRLPTVFGSTGRKGSQVEVIPTQGSALVFKLPRVYR
jgi:hypothetical protein